MASSETQDSFGFIIRWDSKFSIGIPVIDKQHKKLFMLCNTLQMVLSDKTLSNNWEEEYKYALKECVEYVKIHFRDEEKLMQAAGFAGLKEHKEIHASFVRKVLEFSSAESYSIGAAFQLVRFLYEWILSHIAHDDKLFARSVFEYVKKRQAEGIRGGQIDADTGADAPAEFETIYI